ncbi:MAG: hypothetical protein ABI867_02770 [Kofleriaceae bacterium]
MARFLAVLAVLAACGAEPASEPAREPVREPGAGHDAGRQHVDRRDIDVYVDAIPVATIGAHQFASWPQVDRQLPPDATLDRWLAVTLETAGDSVELLKPLSKYPNTVPVVFEKDGQPAFGLFDPRALEHHGAPRFVVAGVREIRIELAHDDPRSATERAFSRACTEPKRGEEKPPVGKGHWVGTAYQFNINEYWTVDLTIDLAESKVGDKVGSVIYHGFKCKGDLYRLPDVNGRRRVIERFWQNENAMCVEACILEFACAGTNLEYRGYYPDGQYVAKATLSRAKK